MSDFATRLILWQRRHGRHGLPWQGADAYGVWLSEVMLQQTQVATVIPYYRRFIASFPTIAALAAASEDQVLQHWSGLGYYARGRNLHATARQIMEKYQGRFPRRYEQILDLPGIGRSTAAAICALVWHERHAILDGNVRRLLARYCGISGWHGDNKVERRLWQEAEALLPLTDVATYTQALMDMGATICTRKQPKCSECAVHSGCVASQTGRVHELPAARPRKKLPERRATFLLLMHGNDILLEKRCSRGIWGSMWCPPQLDNGQSAVTEYMQRNGMGSIGGNRRRMAVESGEAADFADEHEALSPFTHTFTHFRLHIAPVLMRLPYKPEEEMHFDKVWLDLDAALRAAIPTPMRVLFNRLLHESAC